jgi:hypothetical protein
LAWTTPPTATSGATITSAMWNIMRDDLNETGAAKATAAGRIIVTTGANSLAERIVSSNEVQTSESTPSTSNTDLATVGPTVTVTTGPNAVVFWGCQLENATATQQSLMDFAISGASTRAASDTTALRYQSPNASNHLRAAVCDLVTGLTPGSQTVKAKYWVAGGTGTFSRRRLSVMPL